MSSHYWTERGYGILLNFDEAKKMSQKYMEINPGKAKNYYDVLYNLDASHIDDDRYDGRGAKYLKDDNYHSFVDGVMLYLEKPGTIFAGLAATRCYASINEMVKECKKTYGDYLPKDFDYEAKLVYFEGTHYS